MGIKNFKTIDEQIEILRNKGMIVNDELYAKNILLRENYFFLNGYRHIFMISSENKKYINGTTFEELYSLFLFDRGLRNILFKNLLIIENNLKSIISYQLSKKYGYRESDYLKEKNFTKDPLKTRKVNDLLRKMKRQIRINGRQHSATMHYINNYGYIPLWILVKVLSFGIVSELYSILINSDKSEIANVYNIDVNSLEEYLPILANYRNLCAHEDIIYENRTQKIIKDTIYHKILSIDKTNDEYIYGKNDLFALIIIMKQLLRKDEVINMIMEIENQVMNLQYNIHSIPVTKVLDRMGFPINYKEIASIDKREIYEN